MQESNWIFSQLLPLFCQYLTYEIRSPLSPVKKLEIDFFLWLELAQLCKDVRNVLYNSIWPNYSQRISLFSRFWRQDLLPCEIVAQMLSSGLSLTPISGSLSERLKTNQWWTKVEQQTLLKATFPLEEGFLTPGLDLLLDSCCAISKSKFVFDAYRTSYVRVYLGDWQQRFISPKSHPEMYSYVFILRKWRIGETRLTRLCQRVFCIGKDGRDSFTHPLQYKFTRHYKPSRSYQELSLSLASQFKDVLNETPSQFVYPPQHSTNWMEFCEPLYEQFPREMEKYSLSS